MPVTAKRIGSIKNLKKIQKERGGSGTFIKYVPKNGAVVVRFLTEVDDIVAYDQHWDAQMQASYPCTNDDDCPGCETNERKSLKYLANVIDTEADKVVPFQFGQTVMNALVRRNDKYDTLTDRDYEVSRSGEGLETEYDVTPEPASKRNTKKYEALDLQQVLEDAYNNAHGVTSSTSSKKSSKTEKPSKGKRGRPKKERSTEELAQAADDGDDLTEDEETRLYEFAEGNDLDPDDYETWSEVVDAASGSKKKKSSKKSKPVDDDEDEDDDDEDDTDDSTDESEDDDEDSDDEDDDETEEKDDEDSDDEDFYDEEELKALSLSDLKELAKEGDVYKKGMKKKEMIAALLG